METWRNRVPVLKPLFLSTSSFLSHFTSPCSGCLFPTGCWQMAAFSPCGGKLGLLSSLAPQRRLSNPRTCWNTVGGMIHPSLTDPARWCRAESGLYQKLSHAPYIHNEITQHGDGLRRRWHTERGVHRNVERLLGKSASAARVSGRCTVTVQRSLTCSCSTGLSHSSCSSLMSMSEDSWSRNTVHGFSI